MKKRSFVFLSGLVLLLWGAISWADSYSDTESLFRKAGESAWSFGHSYGYAVFPTIGKGGLVVGAPRTVTGASTPAASTSAIPR